MVLERLFVRALLVIGLHRLDVLNALAHIGTDVGDLVLRAAGEQPHAAPKDHDRPNHQGDAQHDDAGELGVGDEQEDSAPDHHQQIAQRHRHGGSDHGLQQGGISRNAGLDLPAEVFLEIPRMQGHQVREHGGADIGRHPFAEPGHPVEPRKGAEGLHHRHDEKPGNGEPQGFTGPGDEAHIHDDPHKLHEGKRYRRGENQCHRCQGNLLLVRPQKHKGFAQAGDGGDAGFRGSVAHREFSQFAGKVIRLGRSQ